MQLVPGATLTVERGVDGGLVGRLALEGGLAGNVTEEFHDVGELGSEVVATGVKALEYIARKQDEFAALASAVQDLVGSKK